MDTEILTLIAQNPGAVPDGYSVQELTPKLIEQLGAVNLDHRETSFDALARWIYQGPGALYSAAELQQIGQQMARDLGAGIGERGTDTVFRRAFSALILAQVIAADNRQPYLDAPQILTWLDRSLVCFGDEQDKRGWVPGKGWAHAIAHTADLFEVFARHRYLQTVELKRILDAIAQKVSEPTDTVYIYEEDERLVSAVIAVMLCNRLVLADFAAWLDRLAHPPGQLAWNQVQSLTDTNEALAYARVNTRMFLRSLYFQLLLGNNPHPSFAERVPAMRDALLPLIVAALRAIDRWVYAQ